MLHRLVMPVAAIGLAAAIACLDLPTSATIMDWDRIETLWTEGQGLLARQSQVWAAAGAAPVSGDIYSVSASRFFFVAHAEALAMDGQPVGGYYDPRSKSIHYYEPMMDGAIPHEAAHAILHALGDPRWACVFHTDCPP